MKPEAPNSDRPASPSRREHATTSNLAVGRLDYLVRLISSLAAARLAKRNALPGRPQLACFPRDYIGIGRAIVANGLYEDLLLRCLFDRVLASHRSTFAESSALDIGANIGNHSCVFATMFRSVVAFEPNPICIRIFEANILMNRIGNVRLHPFALSERNGRAALHVNSTGNIGGSRLSGERLAAGDSIDVEIRRGEDIMLADGPTGDRVALVKIDVEGHEHAVLKGLEKVLRADKPILLFESTRASGIDGSNAILDTLRAWGFGFVYTIEPNSIRSGSMLSRALNRIFRPYEIVFSRVEKLEDRYYSLVVVSCEPLPAP
jgi:FkbM family methyltransferase